MSEPGKIQEVSKNSLESVDPALFELINKEQKRQKKCIELIASENFTSEAVMECLGSCLTNKYSEGYPGRRCYGGNEFIDQIENMAKTRSLEAFNLDPEKWSVNVQPYSGSPANFAVYTALVEPGGTIMGLSLSAGGHLTHGHFNIDKDGHKKSVSATSRFFNSVPYGVDPDTGLIDYDLLNDLALEHRPTIIICGGSAYPRDWDYERFREIADKAGSLLMCDMAHTAGLIAGGQLKSPFNYCDIVTSTTHKTLRGPRAGIIFSKKEHSPKIDSAVFPGLQGGPHENVVAAIATQMREVKTHQFKKYTKLVCLNAKRLANMLIKKGYMVQTNGTDNHIVLWDLRPQGITGSKIQYLCDKVNITLNMNMVAGDTKAFSPGGVRLGLSAMTTRGLYQEKDMEELCDLLDRVVKLCIEIQEITGKKLADFKALVESNNNIPITAKLLDIKVVVGEFIQKFN